MKKNLLLITSLLIGGGLSAQFTEANAPKAGDQITLYVIDSLAPNMSNATGANATWDYSSYLGYGNETRLIKVTDASATNFASDFPSSSEALELQGLLTSFTTDDVNGREGQGFVFAEPSLGNVIAAFTVDPEVLYTYPFDLGDKVDDSFEGVVKVPPLIQNDIFGNIHAEVDGKGTLKLADNSYNDVLRYKLVDTIYINGLPVFGDLQMTREQYEYYDHSVSNLPIFVHTSLLIVPQNGGDAISDISIVLSLEDPEVMSVAKNELENIKIYPNPTRENVTIQMPNNIENANVVITDAIGQVVHSSELKGISSTIDVSALNNGIYFARISSGVSSIVKNIVIQ